LGDRANRTLLHFTVLTYLDQLAYQSLPPTAAATLSTAVPDNWLPFGETSDLVAWRDLVAAQLAPGAETETAAIFAGRLNMSTETFAANLQDENWMASNIFRIIPMSRIQAILQTAVPRSIQLITNYLYLID